MSRCFLLQVFATTSATAVAKASSRAITDWRLEQRESVLHLDHLVLLVQFNLGVCHLGSNLTLRTVPVGMEQQRSSLRELAALAWVKTL